MADVPSVARECLGIGSFTRGADSGRVSSLPPLRRIPSGAADGARSGPAQPTPAPPQHPEITAQASPRFSATTVGLTPHHSWCGAVGALGSGSSRPDSREAIGAFVRQRKD